MDNNCNLGHKPQSRPSTPTEPQTYPASGGGLQNQDWNQSQTADNTLNRNHYQNRSQQGNTECNVPIPQGAETANRPESAYEPNYSGDQAAPQTHPVSDGGLKCNASMPQGAETVNRRESTDERNYCGDQAAPQTESCWCDARKRLEPSNLPPHDQPSSSGLNQCLNQPNYGFQTAINDGSMRDVNVQAVYLRQINKAEKQKSQQLDVSTNSGPINEDEYESSVEEVPPKRGKGRPAHHNKEENKMLADKAIGICDNFDEQQNKMEAFEFVETTAIQLILKEFDKKPPANGRTPLKSSRPFPRDWRPGTVNLPELLDVPEKLAAYLAERIGQFQIIEKRARESIRGEVSRDKSKKDLSNAVSDNEKALEEFKEDYRRVCDLYRMNPQWFGSIFTDFRKLQEDVAAFNLDKVHVPPTLNDIMAENPDYKEKYANPNHISNILSREKVKRLKNFCQTRTGKIRILHRELRRLRQWLPPDILDDDDVIVPAINPPPRPADQVSPQDTVPVVGNEELLFSDFFYP